MLKIKLSPTGKKHARHFRIVVVEEHSKLTGAAVANLGFFDPSNKTQPVKVDLDQVKAWMVKGAQPTLKLRQLLNL